MDAVDSDGFLIWLRNVAFIVIGSGVFYTTLMLAINALRG